MQCTLPAFVEQAPDYEVRDGKVYVAIGGGLTLVWPVHVWLDGCAKGQRAIAEWNKGQRGQIVPFKRT